MDGSHSDAGCRSDLDGDTHIDVICFDGTEELTWYDNTGR